MGQTPEAGTPPQYPIESVDNALKILLLFGENTELRLTDVRHYLGVASSTAHRLLAMLQWRGFVRQDPTSKVYRPGPALTTIAFSILQKMDVPRIAKPVLDELTERLGETVHLGSLDGGRVRFLAVAEPAAAVRVASRLGKQIPAHTTSTGKVLLASLSAEELYRLYPNEDLPPVTERSIVSRAELLRQIERVRIDGFAVNREESEEGVGSVAVALPFTGNGHYALNMAAPIHRLPAGKVKSVAAELKAAAERLTQLLS